MSARSGSPDSPLPPPKTSEAVEATSEKPVANSTLQSQLGYFRAWLKLRVLTEFYRGKDRWCQGSANLTYSALVGCVVPDCNSGHQLVRVGWSWCP